MTITYDTNNAYLGDVLFGNHSLNYPNTNYVKAYDIYTVGVAQINADISAMMTTLGIPHTITGTYGANPWRIDWSNPNDTTRPAAGRFSIGFINTDRREILNARNDAGTVVMGISNTLSNYNNVLLTTAQADPYLSRNHLSIYIRAMRTDSVTNFYDVFLHSSYLQDVNPSYGFYTDKKINSCFVAGKSVANNWYGYHYVEPSNKMVLTTGEANYPIVCADAQKPEFYWMTGWYIFENNPTLGNPAIGRVPGMLVSTSPYTSGRPVKILGTVTPDGDTNKWLPIGTWMGKTIFMRIFSSFTSS